MTKWLTARLAAERDAVLVLCMTNHTASHHTTPHHIAPRSASNTHKAISDGVSVSVHTQDAADVPERVDALRWS